MRFRRRKDNGLGEAERALSDAVENLEEVKSRGDEVSSISNALRDLREHNHFGEQLEEIIHRNIG